MKEYKESIGLVLNGAAGLVTDIRLMVSVPLLLSLDQPGAPGLSSQRQGSRKRRTTSSGRRYRLREVAHIMVKFLSIISERLCRSRDAQKTAENQVLHPTSEREGKIIRELQTSQAHSGPWEK